jgi:uncharacterized protein (DUF58 family)
VRRLRVSKLAGYAGLGAFGLLAALTLGLPELAAVAAPFAVLAVLGLALVREPAVTAAVEVSATRVLEDDEVDVTLRLRATAPAERLEALVVLPDGLALAEGENMTALRLRSGDEHEHAFRLRCERWGAYGVGEVLLRAADPLGLRRWEGRLDRRSAVRVYPRPEQVGRLLRPFRTQVFSGNHVSREKAEGIEFADLRQFVPGDRVRRVNWRASARRGELWVNEYHAERNSDVVLFIDTFSEVGEPGGNTLDQAVRAASALAEHYLRQKDRVGVVSFGGRLSWLLPGTGPTHLYRILDAVLESEIVVSFAWKDVDIVPRRMLPPHALVIALTPLLDDRAIAALLDLRARGFDLAVIEVSPLPFVGPGSREVERLAYRLWQLRREAVRARFEAVAAPVAVWTDDRPLVAVLEEVREWRRHVARARA